MSDIVERLEDMQERLVLSSDDDIIIFEAVSEIKKLRAALAFYADDDNWRLNGPLDANSGNFTGGPAKEIVER